MKFPLLPTSPVSVFIADCDIDGALVIKPPKIPALPEGLRAHADMGICLISPKTAVTPPETFSYYKEKLAPFSITVIEGKTKIGSNYPYDSAYNVGIVGKKCFLNKKVCDSTLFDILISEGFEIIEVKQGYAKCSICPICENTFITADRGIEQKGASLGMDVLLIENDGIFLRGYENGFFGGCTGLSDSNTLLVNGDLSSIPSGEKIRNFLSSRGIKIISLNSGPVTDIGSILPVSSAKIR